MEYCTLFIDGHPDGLVNRMAAQGWRLAGLTTGGFDREGKFHPLATIVWLERARAGIPPDPVPARGSAKSLPKSGR